MRPKLSVTITDVAKEAGVSIATVSRFINHLGTVSPDTEKRVRDAMAKVKYTPKPRRRLNGKPGRWPCQAPVLKWRVKGPAQLQPGPTGPGAPLSQTKTEGQRPGSPMPRP